MEGLTGASAGPVLLVRPVPAARAALAEVLFADHGVPLGDGGGPGLGVAGVVVWELCDPASGDDPPGAVVATRPRESDAVVEVLGAAVAPGGSAAALLRRLVGDVAAALRPAGYPMLVACAPRTLAEVRDLLVAAGFAARPGFGDPFCDPGPHPAQGAAQPGPEPGAGPREASLRDVMWFTMEL